MKKLILISIFFVFAFLSRAYSDIPKEAEKDIESHASIYSFFLTEDAKQEKERLFKKIKNNPDIYVPVVEKMVSVEKFENMFKPQGKYSYRFQHKMALLGNIGNKDAMGILKKMYFELAEWQGKAKGIVEKKHQRKALNEAFSIRMTILHIFAKKENPAFWEHCLELLKQKKDRTPTLQSNALRYLEATYKKKDGESVRTAIQKIKQLQKSNKIYDFVKPDLTIAILSGEKKSPAKTSAQMRPNGAHGGRKTRIVS